MEPYSIESNKNEPGYWKVKVAITFDCPWPYEQEVYEFGTKEEALEMASLLAIRYSLNEWTKDSDYRYISEKGKITVEGIYFKEDYLTFLRNELKNK